MIQSDGMNLAQELVEQGWCWWYRKYAPGDAVREGLEKEAREAKERVVGRSASGAAVEWRNNYREKRK